jgi:hypothetical protein
MTVGEQTVDKVRAKETGAAGDNDAASVVHR